MCTHRHSAPFPPHIHLNIHPPLWHTEQEFTSYFLDLSSLHLHSRDSPAPKRSVPNVLDIHHLNSLPFWHQSTPLIKHVFNPNQSLHIIELVHGFPFLKLVSLFHMGTNNIFCLKKLGQNMAEGEMTLLLEYLQCKCKDLTFWNPYKKQARWITPL